MRGDLEGLLRALPPGRTLWLRGLGRSMAPLLQSGDSLKVLRCAADDVRPGDIAVLRGPDGRLTAHVVDARGPLVTSSFLGRRDAEALEVLGRVVAVRRGPVSLPLPRGGRHVVGLLHRGAAAAWRQPWAREAVRASRDFVTSAPTAPLRRWWVGPVSAERLRPEHREALLLFAGDHLRFPAEFLERQLLGRWQGRGVAAGAFGGRARRMVGFAYLDGYAEEGVPLEGVWVRGLVVAPVARGMGVAGQLVGLLCEQARTLGVDRVYADVRADNAPSLRSFQRLGFTSADAAFEAHARRVLESGRPGERWLVLERRIATGG